MDFPFPILVPHRRATQPPQWTPVVVEEHPDAAVIGSEVVDLLVVCGGPQLFAKKLDELEDIGMGWRRRGRE